VSIRVGGEGVGKEEVGGEGTKGEKNGEKKEKKH